MKTATDARGLTFVQVSELCFLSITLVYARMHFLKIIKEKTIPQSLERATLFGVWLYSRLAWPPFTEVLTAQQLCAQPLSYLSSPRHP